MIKNLALAAAVGAVVLTKEDKPEHSEEFVQTSEFYTGDLSLEPHFSKDQLHPLKKLFT